jgi:hypothetical protein
LIGTPCKLKCLISCHQSFKVYCTHGVPTCTLQVATPGLQAAHHYIWGLTQELQAAAQAHGDIIVQAALENYTGSTDFDFVVRVWVCG